jgi:hypothetical protein
MTWQIHLVPYNVFDLADTVTITGTADTGHPETRLYDFAENLLWKYTGTSALTFNADMGAGETAEADILIVRNHNFSGETWTWQYDDDDSGYTTNDTGTATAADICETISTAVDDRYHQLTISSMTDPQCGEICIGLRYSFDVDRTGPPVIGNAPNVQWNRLVDGGSRSTKFGPNKKTFNYTLMLDATDLASFIEAVGYLDEFSLPFFFVDHLGDCYLVRFASAPQINYMQENNTQIQIAMAEI